MSREIVVTYYAGAYGPTLRIDLISREHLSALKATLASLASGKVRHAEFTSLLPARYNGCSNVILEVAGNGEDGIVTKRDSVFLWSASLDGWQLDVDLLDGFQEEPGHHYLTEEGRGDALVVVAFRETEAEE